MYGGMYLGSWPLGGRSEGAREQLDRRVLFEARMTTEIRGASRGAGEGLVARLRSALGGRPEPLEPSCCPA